MKNIYKIPAITILLLSIVACNDDFLEQKPQTSLSELNTFNTNTSIEAYSFQFYETFPAHFEPAEIGGVKRNGSGIALDDEDQADLIEKATLVGNNWLWNRVTVPSSSGYWSQPYKNIRAINLLLDNVPKSNLSQIDKDHWRSVGLFFKAYEYFQLLKLYGGIPLVEKTVTDVDTDVLYAPRNSRDEVASTILKDLLWAESHIKAPTNAYLKNKVVDANVVNALLSQFGLFEGTWRKYHGLSDQDTYLKASVVASEKLLPLFSIHPNFDELHNSENLAGNKEMILYKEYNELGNWSKMSTTFRTADAVWDITRKGVDLFLCKDGKTRWNSPMFLGDQDQYKEFRNRDIRLLFMTPAPYKVNAIGTTEWSMIGLPSDASNFYFNEYLRISDSKHKTLPESNWKGLVLPKSPHFDQNSSKPFNRTFSGYRVWRHYNQLNTGIQAADYADAPIFRMGEVLLNYAEAKFELGQFTQAIADVTINKLRPRGEVANMVVASINADFDPTRDPSVAPVLWEIRRERAIELMAEGFRREDLRRWKKMDYAAKTKLGRWIKASDQANKVPIQGGAAQGYVQRVPGTPPSFPDHYYLWPIPTDQLVLNPKLIQNPGWK